MATTINAIGLACPQPVILTKKALQEHDDVTVIVDNTTAVENVKRMANSLNCSVSVEEKNTGEFTLNISKGVSSDQETGSGRIPLDNTSQKAAGPNVFAISSDKMGKGDDKLGALLMRSFIHTVMELDNKPDTMIFYNTGVKLVVKGSEVLDDLKTIEESGVKILVCGTCLNFFELTGDLQAGIVSNMYDIAGALSTAGRTVMP